VGDGQPHHTGGQPPGKSNRLELLLFFLRSPPGTLHVVAYCLRNIHACLQVASLISTNWSVEVAQASVSKIMPTYVWNREVMAWRIWYDPRPAHGAIA